MNCVVVELGQNAIEREKEVLWFMSENADNTNHGGTFPLSIANMLGESGISTAIVAILNDLCDYGLIRKGDIEVDDGTLETVYYLTGTGRKMVDKVISPNKQPE